MISIGLISDTHGFLDQNVFKHFDIVDEIWHAGDIGENGVLDNLSAFKPCKAVFGNIDTIEMQRSLPEVLVETIEGVKIMMIHIAGRPGRYAKGISALIKQHQPHLLICGHSHILRVERDAKHNLLYINPGAAGQHGFHQKRTLIRFRLDQTKIENMEVIDLGRRGKA